MEERIRLAINKALNRIGATEVKFDVEWPADHSHGDYATNVALKAFGPIVKDQLKNNATWTVWRPTQFNEEFKNPHAFGTMLLPYIKEELGDVAASVTIAGPGFINIKLSRVAIAKEMRAALAAGEKWGRGAGETGKRVSVEYSNPNPFKEMHIGHLMSNVVGESVSRLIENAGATVVRDTFGGDVGPHVAKALWGLQKMGIGVPANPSEIGTAYAEGSNAYDTDENAKREIDDLNVRIYDVVGKQEDGVLSKEDLELLEIWRVGRELSMEEFRRLFILLGTKLDYEFFDSDTTAGGMRVVNDGLASGIFEKSDGAIIYRGEKKGLHTLVFITSRGTPTYETKDVGLAFLREERIGADEFIIVTAVEQIGHFNVFLAALEDIAPLIAKKTKHVAHGLLRLPSGKMSSRKGNIITAADLLSGIIEKTTLRNDDALVAEMVGVGAVKYMILRQGPGSDIVFDEEKSLSLEGDSGPYLQYALVRAKSILAKALPAAGAEAPSEIYTLERLLVRFPEVAARAASALAPNQIVTYLTEIAASWNRFYAEEKILGDEHEAYKLQVAKVFVQTMHNGLWLLGIKAPERM